MKVKLVKDHSNYHLVDDTNFIIGTTDKRMLSCTDKHKLSLRNCQAIERGYDLDELAVERLKSHLTFKDEEDYLKIKGGFIIGFRTALDCMGDKKFILSEKDLHKVIDMARLQGEESFLVKHSNEEIIQSLQQTEWDVEVIMECPQCQEWGYTSECRSECNKKFIQPKLDADSCIILKKI